MRQTTGAAPLCTTLLPPTWTESKRALGNPCLELFPESGAFHLFMVLCCLSQRDDAISTGMSLRCVPSSTVSCCHWEPSLQVMWHFTSGGEHSSAASLPCRAIFTVLGPLVSSLWFPHKIKLRGFSAFALQVH